MVLICPNNLVFDLNISSHVCQIDLYVTVLLCTQEDRWAGHIARMGERRVAYRVFVGKPERTTQLKRPRVDGRIILKWILEKWV